MMECKIRSKLLSFISIPTDVRQTEAYRMRNNNLKVRISQRNECIMTSGLKVCQTKYDKTPLNQEKRPDHWDCFEKCNGVYGNWTWNYLLIKSTLGQTSNGKPSKI